MTEAAAAQRQFAADNDAIADRLAAGGFDGLASAYRHSAREHEAAARRLDTEAGPDAAQGAENGTLRLNGHARPQGP